MTGSGLIQRKAHLDALATSVLLICCLFWGFQQVLVKATLPELPPVFQAGVRFAAATLLLWIWCRWRGVALFAPDGSWWPGLLAGMLFAAEFACIYLGLQHTRASRLTLFVYTSPFWVALVLPWFVASERLSRWQWLGLIMAFGGLVLALQESLWGGLTRQQGWGDLLAVLGGITWALTTVTLRATRLGQCSPEKQLFYQTSVSSLALPLLSLALGENWNVHFSVFSASSLIIQTVVGAFASYLIWMWLLARYPATRISAFAFLTPMFAMVWGALWLHEPISPQLLGAMLLVSAGILLVNRR
jgi:drug/metabolite transporter (DMT)-like permease